VAGHRTWLEAASVSADLPIGGQAADGAIEVGSMRVAGEAQAAARVPVAWRSAVVSAGPWQPVVRGVKSECLAQLSPAGPLPFVVDWRVAPQELPRREWGGGWQVAARQGEVTARGGGYLRAPATWQAELRARAAGLSGEAAGQPAVAFEDVLARVVARNGVLLAQDLRALGEGGSLLGNGCLFPDGRLAANGRLVVPRDTAAGIQQRFARILPAVAFRPLETPDRWLLDARLGGNLGEPWIEFGDGPTQRVKRLLEEARRVDSWQQPRESPVNNESRN
jgi:hypothetical protein